MCPVSMLGQNNCGAKDYEIKTVNKNSKTARVAELQIANEE